MSRQLSEACVELLSPPSCANYIENLVGKRGRLTALCFNCVLHAQNVKNKRISGVFVIFCSALQFPNLKRVNHFHRYESWIKHRLCGVFWTRWCHIHLDLCLFVYANIKLLFFLYRDISDISRLLPYSTAVHCNLFLDVYYISVRRSWPCFFAFGILF